MGYNYCNRCGFTDGDIVSEAKLLALLQDEVLARKLERPQNGRKRKASALDEEELDEVSLAAKTVGVYTSAICSLGHHQRSVGLSRDTAPLRGALLRGTLRYEARKTHARAMEMYADRGARTLLDGYGTEGF